MGILSSADAVAASAAVLASSGEGGTALFGLILFAVPFVVGWFTYATLYKRYRNQNARYQFEHTTAAERLKLQRWDTFVREKTRMRNSTIDGRNDDDPHERAHHAIVREAMEPRNAQAAREAQEPRIAQEARLAQEAREAQATRQAEPERAEQPERSDQPRGEEHPSA
ncbi:hypothetical protein [Demequina sp. NBRC 110053]|uniref:hypothetical protein n=1 Tax=Demequina sp. NBRC 110053 TaxID=1570342 RepID=UPI000A065D14|nr:hypothetical protein [Demequina sp. NBRC 110053]